jgi:hypothetical protein
MDIYRKRLLWNGGSSKNKYHLVKWDTVCTAKNIGGLGILNLRWMNISLLTKWLWKLEKEDGLWQTIVKKKYMKGKPLSVLKKKQGDSQFWRGIMDNKEEYCKNRKMEIGNGYATSFWMDKWCGDESFCIKYKRLFDLSLNTEISVNKALRDSCNSLIFRRRLFGVGANLLECLKMDCDGYCFKDSKDKPYWILDKKRFFSEVAVQTVQEKYDQKTILVHLESENPSEN